jgi:protein-arginine kinase activator protein McsA
MSTELLSPELDLELQEEVENDDQMTKDMEQEMECPRCYDMMTLSSDYDRPMYICQECYTYTYFHSDILIIYFQ